MLDQVEERRLGPVEVVHHDDERPRSRERLEQPPDGPEGLLARPSSRAAEPERLGHALGDQLGLLVPGEPRRDRRCGLLAGVQALRARDLPDDLGQRPVGDALAVGQAAAAQDRHVAGEPARELPHEPRLAHARVAEHGQQVAGPIADRVAEHGLEHGTLALAPDEGRVEAARKAGGVGEDVYHDEGVDRLAVLERARPARLDDDRVAHEPVRRLPDQDLVRRRRLLEALGDVDGLSGDEQMSLRVVAGDHLAGVDADPVGQADAPTRFELAVEDGECVAHLDRRPHRAQRVVLVEDRHAEHRHDRVADVLLHDPAVPSDDGAQLAEVAREQVPERFRIEGEAEPRGVDDVGEEDRDRLADVRGRFPRLRHNANLLCDPSDGYPELH